MTKLLLFRGSPRSDIDEVEQYNDKFPCDTLIIRYTNELPAYWWARHFLLRHEEYDYLVLATDDIIVKPEHIEQLQKDLEENDYKVLSGVMNVNQEDYPDGDHNICMNLPNQIKRARIYKWVKYSEMPDEDIFQVAFAGFGLTAIHRSIVAGIPFAGDGRYKGHGDDRGASLDLVFCYDCKELNIPIFVDKRIKMHHLRTSGTHQVNIKPPITEYYKDGQLVPVDDID